MRRRPISFALALLSMAAVVVLPHVLGSAAPRPSLDAYRGLGTWVDIYDKDQYYDPATAVAQMASHGVRTLYLETANYHSKKDIVFPIEVDRFIDAAHANGMRVVAWYLPSFNNPQRDLRRSLAAIRRTTSTGGHFDSFGLDIESEAVSDVSLRTQRLLQLSSEIRTAVGPSYPLSAIIPSPKNMQARPDFWPGFPYRQLTRFYDVFQPMSYYTFRVSNAAGAYAYIAGNIDMVRAGTGDPTIPIHVIGGIADSSTAAEDRAVVRAARERGILGASLYDFATSTSEDWQIMAGAPDNPPQSKALPISLPAAGAYGNVPGGDQTHPKEVWYRTGSRSGAATLRFQVDDVQQGEVSLYVNWRLVGTINPTNTNSWGVSRSVRVPGSMLHSGGQNLIGFVARGNRSHWSVWGVRRVSIG
jgi:hypothetical protein